MDPTPHRIRALGSFACRAFRDDPRLLPDYLRLYLIRVYRNAHLGRSSQLDRRPAERAVGWAEGPGVIARAAGAWSEGDAVGVVRSSGADGGPAGSPAHELALDYAGDQSLGELVYALVRATRPDAVIETGVATGVTSAFVLAGLEDNGHGELHSVDLPPAALVTGGLVGCRIPRSLRHRWRYRWGDARRLLPGVLHHTRGRRVFIHDSDHGYQAMRWELERAWDALGPDDWIVADDVNLHCAFTDVAARHGARAYLIEQKEKRSCTGLMQRR